MSLHCPTSPVYHTSVEQKLKSQNAAKAYRYGTPKLRDMLREKCRVRVHEARQSLFQKTRDFSSSQEQLPIYNEILRQELAELEHDIDLQEKIYEELVQEVNEWFVDQQEQEAGYLVYVAESNAVICPVCQKHTLETTAAAVAGKYKCQCGLRFKFSGDFEQLRLALQNKINWHEQQCTNILSFFAEPRLTHATAESISTDIATINLSQENILNAMCSECDFFCSL